MFKRFLSLAAIVMALATLSGCSTMADARAAKGSGVAREYSAPVDVVWNAMPQVLTDLGLDLAGENKEEGYILAQRSMTLFSYGENVAIFIKSIGDATMTRVEVVSKRAVATNVFAPSWEKEILEKLGEKLKTSS